MRAILLFLILTIGGSLCAQPWVEWEARLPYGAETNLVELNRAKGNQVGADYISEGIRMSATYMASQCKAREQSPSTPDERDDHYEVDLRPFAPKGLSINPANCDGLVRAQAKHLPPDMLGSGPFFLIKHKDAYFMLTATNFCRLFGPVTEQAKVLPLVDFHEEVFGDDFASIVTNPEAKYWDDTRPPEITTVEPTDDGFAVKLILFNALHRVYFGEKHLLVHTNGNVEVTKELKIIKDLGEGYMF